MNKQIKDKWVAALRGGDYNQGRGVLRMGDKYCCLGVLCDLHAKETNNEWDDGEYLGSIAYIPEKVTKWLETKYPGSVLVGFNGRFTSLAYLNDSIELDFNQIADLIENTYEQTNKG